MVSSLLLFNKRRKLVKRFEAWCEQNNVDDTDRTNLLTWLYMNDLLNVDKIISFLDSNKEAEISSPADGKNLQEL